MTRIQIINTVFWASMGVYIVAFWWIAGPVIFEVIGGAIKELTARPEACRFLFGADCVAAMEGGL